MGTHFQPGDLVLIKSKKDLYNSDELLGEAWYEDVSIITIYSFMFKVQEVQLSRFYPNQVIVAIQPMDYPYVEPVGNWVLQETLIPYMKPLIQLKELHVKI